LNADGVALQYRGLVIAFVAFIHSAVNGGSMRFVNLAFGRVLAPLPTATDRPPALTLQQLLAADLLTARVRLSVRASSEILINIIVLWVSNRQPGRGGGREEGLATKLGKEWTVGGETG